MRRVTRPGVCARLPQDRGMGTTISGRIRIFQLLLSAATTHAVCPTWCDTFHCDGSAWCQHGEKPAPCTDCHAVTTPASCNDQYCTSPGNDCCAPPELGEQATCSHGYTAERFDGPCFGWAIGSYRCCLSSTPASAPVSAPAPGASTPAPSPAPRPLPAISSAAGSAADRINRRFRDARPSNNIEEVSTGASRVTTRHRSPCP